MRTTDVQGVPRIRSTRQRRRSACRRHHRSRIWQNRGLVVGEAFMPVIGANTGKVSAKSRPRGPPSAATPGGTPHGIRDVLKRTVEGSGAPVQCSKRREEV